MDYNDNTPSCLMLAANLDTPVSLGSIFETDDLTSDTGISFDSHITLLFSHTFLDKDTILGNIDIVAEKDEYFTKMPGKFNIDRFLETQNKIKPKPVLELFDLGIFNGKDSDILVLKLKKTTGIFEILEALNRGLSSLYNVKSDFDSYNPHITLANLKPGVAQKYLDSDTLLLMLENSVVNFEDLVFSYSKEDGTYDDYDLTHNNSVDRFFRLEDLRKEYREVK